jgi:hypothetical protein
MRATSYQFAHHRTVDGERCLIWGNGIGELLIPVNSPDYQEALNDRIWSHNDLTNQGEDELLNTYFRALAKKTTLYGRLYGAGTFTDTSTLASTGGATEVTGTGYAPTSQCAWTVGDTHFGAPANVGSSQTTTSQTRTFTAGGTWTAAVSLVLSDAATGTSGMLIAWVGLSATRTLVATDTLDVSIAVGLN